jgi:hypothetical protein
MMDLTPNSHVQAAITGEIEISLNFSAVRKEDFGAIYLFQRW